MSQHKVQNVDEQTVDPVIVEIIRNGLFAVTEEMKTNLMRTAYNLIIYEALDFTVGLFTKEGETVSIGLGLPMFIRGMSETVKSKIRHFGYENIHPGDIMVTNDAYTTGSHLNHFTFTMPVFHEGELIGFTCCMAHWLDVGGSLGQITTDIFSEGIQIPIVKYQSAGKVNQDLVDIIAMNVRMPERALGDLPNIDIIVFEPVGRLRPDDFTLKAMKRLEPNELRQRVFSSEQMFERCKIQ